MRGQVRAGAWAALAFACVLSLADAAAADSFFSARRGGLGVEIDRLTSPLPRDYEQVLVLPQRPGRTNVRYFDFDWRRYDFLEDQGVGGVSFYFYDRELELARVAAHLVRTQYEWLSERFNYRPTTRVPYILYNSHREFQNTNAFFVSEGVLGVTSPMDLRMALPYWGERRRFREVSLHEMVHQFTIQKAADRAAALGLDNPVMLLPLWYIEGIAEWYSKEGIDRETDMFARDLLLNPRPEKGYLLIDFWMDVPGAFVYTYKLGQLRVAFLAEQYGERIIQAILDQSPRLGAAQPGESKGKETFETLVSRLAREEPEAIAHRFQAWLRRRYFPEYLETTQEPPLIPPVNLPGEPDEFSTGPDGYTLLYRSVERNTGRSRLYIADRRDAESARQVAIDGKPGTESLHPVLRSVTAVASEQIAWLARDGESDALFVMPFTRKKSGNHVSFELGRKQRIELSDAGIIEAGDPAFSPDGENIAFFGLDDFGLIDIWVANVQTGVLRRVTNDSWAERDIAWAPEPPKTYGINTGSDSGTLIFASDESVHGYFNLVALDPNTGLRKTLTNEAADHREPAALGDGQIVFSSDASGKLDLHLYDAGTKRLKRLTDFITGLTNPTPGPKGLMALGIFGGQYQMFDVPRTELLSLDERPAIEGEIVAPPPPETEPIPSDAPLYEPMHWKNWRLENGVAAIGTSSVGQGALLFSDMLSDRSLLVQLAMYGSPSLTDALLFYMNRSHRSITGLGVFHTFTQRRDLFAPGFGGDVLYLQREFGVTGLWAYPFNTFMRVEARGVIQGVDRNFQFPVDSQGFASYAVDTKALRTWDSERGGLDLETLLSLRIGYDTTRYRYPSGAFGGMSMLLELGGGYLPLRSALHHSVMFDGQLHLGLIASSTLHLRLAGGWAGGSTFARQFFLSSYDNLRMFPVNDRRLLGSVYTVANADLEIPLDRLVALAFISNLEAVVGLDFGGVSDRFNQLWDARALALVLGMNVGLGPFEVRVHFARPFDINPLVPFGAGWQPNISLRYAYF